MSSYGPITPTSRHSNR
jgi:hypothetical protein